MKILSLFLLFIVSTNIFAFSLFGPKNYDECILENMKGVSSDIAARLVDNSCDEKFKEKVVDNSKKREWILDYTDDESSYYYDKSSITKYGKIVTVDVLRDFNKQSSTSRDIFNKLASHNDTFSFYSLIVRYEYDCSKLNFRDLSLELKSGHMGDGKVVAYTDESIPNAKEFLKTSSKYKRYCSN
ncbi:MAG: hypothetical protein NT008_07535 [Methylococcales bacterium]|nr:hypothetical protein [Methylococcales bacterium]